MPEISELTDDQLGDCIQELSAHIAAATYRWLCMLAEYDRRRAWTQWGVKSFAHWLNWRTGLDLRSAREKIRVARALETLPLISAAFSRGELSYSKVRAVTRIATPENEGELLVFAAHGTTQHVEKLVRGYRRCVPVDDPYARRFVDYSFDDDGTITIKARLTAEEGKLVINAIDKLREEIQKKHRVPGGAQDGSAEPPHDRADALVELARKELDGTDRRGSTADRYQVFVHVHADVIRGGDGAAFVQDGAGIASETVFRLLCDSSYIGVVRGSDGSVLDIGRKTRSISASIRRALHLRDHGCAFPGCTNHHFVDAHHVQHWIAGGETSLANLVLLCPFHHRLLHEGNFSMVANPDGTWTFLRPDGRIIAVPKLSVESRGVEALNKDLKIDATTSLPEWCGDHPDYSTAIDKLMRDRSTDAPESSEVIGMDEALDRDGSAEPLSLESPDVVFADYELDGHVLTRSGY
jgi:hypothetical protein